MGILRIYDCIGPVWGERDHGRFIGAVCGGQRAWATEDGKAKIVLKSNDSLQDSSATVFANRLEHQI